MTGVKKEPFQLIFLSIITSIINSFKNYNPNQLILFFENPFLNNLKF